MDGGQDAARTEGASADRRRVIRVVEVINLAFLAVDLALYGPANLAVVGGRLLVSAGLLSVDLALAGVEDARLLRRVLVGAALAVVAGFAALAAGSGGAESPYLAFLAFVPIVVTIGIPDEPAVPLAAGLAGTAAGLGFGAVAGHAPARLGFAAVAFGSCTFYGTVSALLYRRMRAREQAAAAARAASMAELARSERRRLEAERLAAIGRLTAGFSHEVNNPLASAAANLAFIRRELGLAPLHPEVEGALADMDEALERIARLVSDLRTVSVEGVEAVTGVDVGEALELAWRLASARLGPGATGLRHVPPDLPPVLASQPHLGQVLGLLVSAAAERGDGGPPERIPAGPRPVTMSVGVEAGSIRIAVEGSMRAPGPPGVGRTRSELCLAICREVAERWGGRIEAAIAPDGSPRFALTLQRAAGGP